MKNGHSYETTFAGSLLLIIGGWWFLDLHTQGFVMVRGVVNRGTSAWVSAYVTIGAGILLLGYSIKTFVRNGALKDTAKFAVVSIIKMIIITALIISMPFVLIYFLELLLG